MGLALWGGALAATRLRRAGPRAFQRAHRALPATRRRGQHPSVPAFERRAIFSLAAEAAAASLAQAAGGVYAEEPSAPPQRAFSHIRFFEPALPVRRAGARSPPGASHPDLQRAHCPWSASAPIAARRHRNRDAL